MAKDKFICVVTCCNDGESFIKPQVSAIKKFEWSVKVYNNGVHKKHIFTVFSCRVRLLKCNPPFLREHLNITFSQSDSNLDPLSFHLFALVWFCLPPSPTPVYVKNFRWTPLLLPLPLLPNTIPKQMLNCVIL